MCVKFLFETVQRWDEWEALWKREDLHRSHVDSVLLSFVTLLRSEIANSYEFMVDLKQKQGTREAKGCNFIEIGTTKKLPNENDTWRHTQDRYATINFITSSKLCHWNMYLESKFRNNHRLPFQQRRRSYSFTFRVRGWNQLVTLYNFGFERRTNFLSNRSSSVTDIHLPINSFSNRETRIERDRRQSM